MPVLHGTDLFKDGHSHMHGTLAGLFTVIDGQGDEVDQGTMVRYLQEMSWFPTAYLGANITWTAVDDHAADVTLRVNDRAVSGRLFFDDNGRLLTFSAQRYGDFGGTFSMQTWTTPTSEYATFGGLRIPAGGMGVWQLPEGDFSYVNVRLTEVVYNEPVEGLQR